ncbi:hypothetical protein CHCC20494_1185 [Bacillus licheniformis]|nr:hypothetical protein CHCC20494_1185 [Bacillus licheniformis]
MKEKGFPSLFLRPYAWKEKLKFSFYSKAQASSLLLTVAEATV